MASVDEVRMVFENPDFYLRRSRHNIRIREETVNDFTQGHDYKRVLDIGCGDGSLSAPLLRARNRLTLLDVSSAMLLKARDQIPRELIRHVEFVNDDFLTAPLIAGYDLIICVGVLAHVSSPISVIRRIGSLLSPNGSVIVQVTDCRHVLSRVMRAYGKLRQWVFPVPYCATALSAEQISNMFAGQGCHLIDVYRYTEPLPGMVRVLSEQSLYRLTRWLYGRYPCGRNAELGNEYLCHFRRA